MGHDRTYHPQIYWIEPGLSPRMRGVVKQSLALAGPQTHSDELVFTMDHAGLPDFLSLTNHQSDDLFCLPFNISLQRGQRPTKQSAGRQQNQPVASQLIFYSFSGVRRLCVLLPSAPSVCL
jgi:hypothetical protein